MDKIVLKGVQVETLIGWHQWERQSLRPLTLDLYIGMPGQSACESDNLVDTIDYEAVVNTLRASLAEQHFLLLEALAEHIANILLQDFGAPWAKVTVIKPGILVDVASVSVEIERSRS